MRIDVRHTSTPENIEQAITVLRTVETEADIKTKIRTSLQRCGFLLQPNFGLAGITFLYGAPLPETQMSLACPSGGLLFASMVPGVLWSN